MQKSKVQRSGNTAELERLEKDLAEALEIKQRNWEAKLKAEEIARDRNKEIVDLKASLKVAYEKIQLLEAGVTKSGEAVKSGYVEIAMCPINGGIYPHPSRVDGVVAPRRKDEDGVIYEFLPVKNAIALMTDGSGFKKYLVGPEGCYKIEGSYVAGLYAKKVVFKKHKKVKTRDGYEFVMVEIEESPEKAV